MTELYFKFRVATFTNKMGGFWITIHTENSFLLHLTLKKTPFLVGRRNLCGYDIP